MLVQDLAVGTFLVAVVAFGNAALGLPSALAIALFKLVVVVILILRVGRVILRPIFGQVAAIRVPEDFAGLTLAIVFAAGWLTQLSGLTKAFAACCSITFDNRRDVHRSATGLAKCWSDLSLGRAVGAWQEPVACGLGTERRAYTALADRMLLWLLGNYDIASDAEVQGLLKEGAAFVDLGRSDNMLPYGDNYYMEALMRAVGHSEFFW